MTVSRQYSPFKPMETVDEFLVVERCYSDDPTNLSVGLANIHAIVPDIEKNKDKVLRAVKIFKQRGVNFAIFPEFSLSGYFWEDEDSCHSYMSEALTENHVDWIESELKPLLNDEFVGIALNNITRAPDGRFYNTTFVVARDREYIDRDNSYDKVFLPGIEKTYTVSGRDDRLVLDTTYGRFGFTTCYDYLFSDLLREYSTVEKADAVIQVASWRAAATRDYPGMNIRTDRYYADLWDAVMAASSATNQIWTMACNAVGRHRISGVPFGGGSGIWAPSGLCLIQASRTNEELLVVHNLDIAGARKAEQDDFNYSFDFSQIYRPLEGSRTFTRVLS